MLPAESTAATAAAAVVDCKVNSKAHLWAGPDGFVQYEEDVQVWLFMTTLADNKKGGAMRMGLSGVAYEACRTVPVALLTTAEGHILLLEALRTAFGGSESNRGFIAYREPNKTYRGHVSMETYLATISLALADCKNNGYNMGGKTAAAVILDQSGLDANQQAPPMATAAMHSVNGMSEVTALTTAMRDLWEGDVPIKSSSHATMVVMTYAEHEAYMARRTTPAGAATGGRWKAHRTPRADPAGCWHCGKTGHVRMNSGGAGVWEGNHAGRGSRDWWGGVGDGLAIAAD